MKWPISQRQERTRGGKEEEKREKKEKTLSEKKEEARHVSEQRNKGWIHVIRVPDATHLATDAHELPQSKTYEQRAKIAVPTTNRWKTKLTITNSN